MRLVGRFELSVESAQGGGVEMHVSMEDADGSFRLNHESTIDLVLDICRKAGLPEPWKE